MTSFVCRRGSSSDGNQLLKLAIAIGEQELFAGGEPFRESDKAYGFKANDQLIWLPKSQIRDFSFDGETLVCWCPRWLIEKNALEIFVDTSHEPGLFDQSE